MVIVYYKGGFMELVLKFWRQISKIVERGFINKAQNFDISFVEPIHCKTFSCIFCLMFLNDTIKPNIENKIN